MGIFSKIFKSYSEKEVKRIMPVVERINGLEEQISKLTDEDLDDPRVWEAVRRSMTHQN